MMSLEAFIQYGSGIGNGIDCIAAFINIFLRAGVGVGLDCWVFSLVLMIQSLIACV